MKEVMLAWSWRSGNLAWDALIGPAGKLREFQISKKVRGVLAAAEMQLQLDL
jgi:hypothetical protein